IARGAGNTTPDVTIQITFYMDQGVQRFVVKGIGSGISGPVTPVDQKVPMITTNGTITAFAGPRDDPFFFDLPAFKAFEAAIFHAPGAEAPYIPAAGLRSAADGPPRNFFRGNVASIVLEMPVTLVTGGTDANSGKINVWSKTFRGF